MLHAATCLLDCLLAASVNYHCDGKESLGKTKTLTISNAKVCYFMATMQAAAAAVCGRLLFTIDPPRSKVGRLHLTRFNL